VGCAKTAISLGFLTMGAANLYDHIANYHEASIIAHVGDFSSDIVLMGLGLYSGRDSLGRIGYSLEHRDRMEATLGRNGFNERIMDQTLETYCDRQATLVACDKFNLRQEYLNLIDTTDKPMAYSNLPHF
jgi:hypothetical protein